ncbi:MAG TPA: SRPBCC family protein [Candidatus Limnocylindrales bacterium]|nr:SRPBCC family protein [Candidatus Limnocylindrales bacterium]
MIRRLLSLGALGVIAAVVADRLLGRRRATAALAPIETFAVVDAPIERVWRTLADVEGQPRWMTDLKSVRLLDDGPVGAGSRAEGTVRILGIPVRDPVTITEFDAPTRFAIRHDGAFGGEGVMTLEPGADGRSTIVRWRERLVPPVLPHLAAVLQRPILRAVFQADLHRLRRLLESPGPG